MYHLLPWFQHPQTLQPCPLPRNSSSYVHLPTGYIFPRENSTDMLNLPEGKLMAIPWHLAILLLRASVSVGDINISQAFKLEGLGVFLILSFPLSSKTPTFSFFSTPHYAKFMEVQSHRAACMEGSQACLLVYCHQHKTVNNSWARSSAFSCTRALQIMQPVLSPVSCILCKICVMASKHTWNVSLPYLCSHFFPTGNVANPQILISGATSPQQAFPAQWS